MLSSHKANPFNPAEWYSLASWLYDTKPASVSQSIRRTIVSRAYYAALICARDATQSNTVGPDGHKNVVDALSEKNPNAGNKLNSLRLKRHSADYKLEDEITDRDVYTSLINSRAVLDALGATPKNVAPHNKPYAQNFLDSDKFIKNT